AIGDGEDSRQLPSHGVAISPDGRTIAAGYSDGSVRLWEAATGGLRATFTGHRSDVGVVRFSPDGTLLASAGSDRSVLVWDLTGQRVAPADGPAGGDAAAWWDDLAAADAGRAYKAVRQFGSHPAEAVRTLADRLPAVARIDASAVEEL